MDKGDTFSTDDSGAFLEMDQDWVEAHVRTKLGLSVRQSQHFAMENSKNIRQSAEDSSARLICITALKEWIKEEDLSEDPTEHSPASAVAAGNVDVEADDTDALHITQTMLAKAKKAMKKSSPKIKRKEKKKLIRRQSETVKNVTAPDPLENVTKLDDASLKKYVKPQRKESVKVNEDTWISVAGDAKIKSLVDQNNTVKYKRDLVAHLSVNEMKGDSMNDHKNYIILYYIRKKHTNHFRKLNKILEQDFECGIANINPSFTCAHACQYQIVADISPKDEIQRTIQNLRIWKLFHEKLVSYGNLDEIIEQSSPFVMKASSFLFLCALNQVAPEFYTKNSLEITETAREYEMSRSMFEEYSTLFREWSTNVTVTAMNDVQNIPQPTALMQYIQSIVKNICKDIFFEFEMKRSMVINLLEYSNHLNADVLHLEIKTFKDILHNRQTKYKDLLQWILPFVADLYLL